MSPSFPQQRILVLAPHTDDAELGCGGTIARLLEEGKQVHVAAFSSAVQSLPSGSPLDRLAKEFMHAMKILGIPQSQIHLYNYPVRLFPSHRQEILDELIALRKLIRPELVFVPSPNDVHQDHEVVCSEGIRAFKEESLFGYELPWNTFSFSSQCVVEITSDQLKKKWEALQAYESQLELQRSYFSWPFIEGLARVRGSPIKKNYAESFEVIRIRF